MYSYFSVHTLLTNTTIRLGAVDFDAEDRIAVWPTYILIVDICIYYSVHSVRFSA